MSRVQVRLHAPIFLYDESAGGLGWCQGLTCGLRIVREDDILCLLESEREARRLR